MVSLEKAKYYVYEMPPTDWFYPFKTLKETLIDIFSCGNDDIYASEMCEKYIEDVKNAKNEFEKRTNWEGDGAIFISGLPTDDGGGFPYTLVMIKQSNNGSTFLCSPVELPFLREYLF